ncbi:NAD(P)H-hydrate dehydratase [bacterium]|nr:MAG: NAD(P)H-hydrate dehydratase [bacterium]
MHVLTREEMRTADAAGVSAIPGGEPSLMGAAGAALAETCRTYAPPGAHVVCFAGRGNNGGDGALALASLASTHRCTLYLLHERHELSISTRVAVERAADRGVTVSLVPNDPSTALNGANLAIEALVGTGSRLPLSPRMEHVIHALNAFAGPVIACDVPAGVDPTTGECVGVTLRARATLSLGAMKCGLLVEPGRHHAGELWISEIGFPARLLDDHQRTYQALESLTFAQLVPERPPLVDKYAAGHVAVVAGSGDYPGAAVLCAQAAARAGAGYVTLFVPKTVAAVVRAHLVEVVVREIPESIDALLSALSNAGSVAIGPGLGRTEETQTLVHALCAGLDGPYVVDADGVVALAGFVDLVAEKPAVLTPHSGEFARLTGMAREHVERDRIGAVRAFAKEHARGPLLVLKGSPTLIAQNGMRLRLGWVGTSTLATAGSGDVLTGTIATLLARGLSPTDAAAAGAFWHGLAGRVAERRRPGGVMAGDICEALPEAMGLVRAAAETSRLGRVRRVLPAL